MRGGYVAYRVNAQNTLEAGVWNSLTYRDPQLNASGGQAATAGTLSWRYRSGDTQLAIGGLAGTRPRLQARDANNNPIEVPDSERRIFYAELQQRIPNTPLKIRADYIWGRDRNPAGGTAPRFLTPSDLQTVFLYAIYEPNPRNQIVLAWEDFDPDTKRGGDRIQTLSLTYHYFVQERMCDFSLRYESKPPKSAATASPTTARFWRRSIGSDARDAPAGVYFPPLGRRLWQLTKQMWWCWAQDQAAMWLPSAQGNSPKNTAAAV
jgi:hypothetical protein